MNSPTSFTKQETMLRCPRRFYFRYLADCERSKSLRRLMAVRELGGHCIHLTLANMVRRIANGERVSDQTNGVESALELFNSVVEESINLRPGVLTSGMQLAESFNDTPCAEDIRDWRELIPLAIQNGVRLMSYFNLRSNKTGYQLEAEQRAEHRYKGRTRRFVIDVLIRDDQTGVTVIDWKTHSISVTDLRQVEMYQHWLLDAGRARPTRIFGFAVDLVNEQVVEAPYRVIDQVYAASRTFSLRSASTATVCNTITDPYPAKPSLTACGICPFATLCPSSALKTMEVAR
jgi:PD-(D/E)XK nuclease superfamily